MKENKAIPLAELLQLRRYNQSYIPPKETPILTINDKICGTLQNYCIISGLPKSCKSTFLSAFTGSALQYEDIWGIKINLLPEKQKIVYFDTESSQYDMWRQMEKIKKFSNRQYLPDEIFEAYNVREDEPNKIIDFINCYLENNKITVLIVDGLLDLCNDFNDILEAKKITSWLKKITKKYNILIIAVIHLGKKDLTSLGHLGSFADRYAQSVFEVIKDKEQSVFTLTPKFMRSDSDFEPVSIKNFVGNWEVVHYEPTITQNFKNSKK